MPKNRPIIHPKQSSTTVPTPHSYTVMQFRSTQNEDDDDICPVCESDCTCGNTNNSQPTPQPAAPQPAAPRPSSPAAAPTSVPLKIKLPPRTYWNFAEKFTAVESWTPKPSKLKQTTADSAIVDGSSSSKNYVVLHHPGPFTGPAHQLGTPAPSASTSTSLSLRDSSPLTPESELEPPQKAKRPSKKGTRNLASPNKNKASNKAKPKSRAAAPQKTLSTRARSKKNEDSTWKTNSIRPKDKMPIQVDESTDDFTDEDAYVTRMTIDSDDESGDFPTFVTAVSTTSDNDDSTSTMTDSFDSDSSIRAEEENMILSEQRDKVRREILNNEESWHMEKRKWDHLKNNNNWEIRPRKRSVGPDEDDSDTNSDSDSEMEPNEEEEEDADDDEDPDIRPYGHGMVTGWQSDDDDFDAELFFATLTDSSGPGSDADEEDGECSGDEHSDNSDLSSISMREAAAAGVPSSSLEAGCPLVVTEDWDGRLVFANGLKDGQGVLDVHFEVDAAQRHRRIREAMEVDAGDTEATVEKDEEEEDEADFISDDGGETTDDMLDHRSGVSTPQGVPLPIRYPTPPVTSIDPLSTFSPAPDSRRKRSTKATLDSPKPADILAGATKMVWDGSNKDCNIVRSPTTSIAGASPPDTSSSVSRQMPSMGSFKLVSADPKSRAIIDGTKATAFSPFTRVNRARRCPERGRKRSATGLDVFPYVSKRPRQSSLPGSSRATLDDGDGDLLVHSLPELPYPAVSIGLDDVLDASFLDSDDSVEPAANPSGERHFRNLSRWDRVPMSTFRRSRTAHMGNVNVRVSRLGPPNDGVSYGSVGGHVLRKSTLGATLWQTSDRMVQSNPGSVTVSPVIFPVRDGYRTSTSDQYLDPFAEPLATTPGPSKSHKQKRKERKNRTRSLHNSSTSSSTSNAFYQPLPIIPSLNL